MLTVTVGMNFIDAAVSFMTQKMEVEFEDGQDDKKVMTEVLKACREVEPDCGTKMDDMYEEE